MNVDKKIYLWMIAVFTLAAFILAQSAFAAGRMPVSVSGDNPLRRIEPGRPPLEVLARKQQEEAKLTPLLAKFKNPLIFEMPRYAGIDSGNEDIRKYICLLGEDKRASAEDYARYSVNGKYEIISPNGTVAGKIETFSADPRAILAAYLKNNNEKGKTGDSLNDPFFRELLRLSGENNNARFSVAYLGSRLLVIFNIADKVTAKNIKEAFASVKAAGDAKSVVSSAESWYRLVIASAAEMTKHQRDFQDFIETECIPCVGSQNISSESRTRLAFYVASIICSLNLPDSTAGKAINSISSLAKSLDKDSDGYVKTLSALAIIAKAHPRFKEGIIEDLGFNETQAGMFRDFGVILIEEEDEGKFSKWELRAMRNVFSVCGPQLLSRVGAIEYKKPQDAECPAYIKYEGIIAIGRHDTSLVKDYFHTDSRFFLSFSVTANLYTTALFHEMAHLIDGYARQDTGMGTPFYRMHSDGGIELFACAVQAWAAGSGFGLKMAISEARKGEPLLLQELLAIAHALSFKKADGKEYIRLFKTGELGDIDCTIVPVVRDKYGIISKIGDTAIEPELIMKEIWKPSPPPR